MPQQIVGESSLRHQGTGPGAQTLDGCSVEFYKRLTDTSDIDIVINHVQSPASLLELGCGVGRLTAPLSQAGFTITAVDNSEDMLCNVNAEQVVLADIESLNLPEKFDTVLLASRLLNTPNPDIRRRFLQTARRHLTPDGELLCEVHQPRILQTKAGDSGQLDDYAARITRANIQGAIAEITIEYTIANDVWTQSFTTEYLDRKALEVLCNEVGLTFNGYIDAAETWFSATAN